MDTSEASRLYREHIATCAECQSGLKDFDEPCDEGRKLLIAIGNAQAAIVMGYRIPVAPGVN